MHHAGLWVALLLSAVLGAGAALAQAPPPGARAAGTGMGATTTAPLPNVAPGVPGNTGPGVLPGQVTQPGAAAAGPPGATPFSAGPSAALPSDQSVILRRDTQGTGQGSPVPNLSK